MTTPSRSQFSASAQLGMEANSGFSQGNTLTNTAHVLRDFGFPKCTKDDFLAFDSKLNTRSEKYDDFTAVTFVSKTFATLHFLISVFKCIYRCYLLCDFIDHSTYFVYTRARGSRLSSTVIQTYFSSCVHNDKGTFTQQ